MTTDQPRLTPLSQAISLAGNPDIKQTNPLSELHTHLIEVETRLQNTLADMEPEPLSQDATIQLKILNSLSADDDQNEYLKALHYHFIALDSDISDFLYLVHQSIIDIVHELPIPHQTQKHDEIKDELRHARKIKLIMEWLKIKQDLGAIEQETEDLKKKLSYDPDAHDRIILEEQAYIKAENQGPQ